MGVTDDIDPLEEFIPREIHPKPIRLEEIDPEKVVVSFDRRSDTLLIHLFGRGRGSVSVPEQRKQAVDSFVNAERARWDLAFVPAL